MLVVSCTHAITSKPSRAAARPGTVFNGCDPRVTCTGNVTENRVFSSHPPISEVRTQPVTETPIAVTTIGSSTPPPPPPSVDAWHPTRDGEIYAALAARGRAMGLHVGPRGGASPTSSGGCPPPTRASRRSGDEGNAQHTEDLRREVSALRGEMARMAERPAAPAAIDDAGLRAAIRAMIPEIVAAIQAALSAAHPPAPPDPPPVPQPMLQLPPLGDDDYESLNTRVRGGQVGRPREVGTQIRIRIPDEVAQRIAGSPDQLRQRMVSVLLLAVHHRVDLSTLPQLYQDAHRLIELVREGHSSEPSIVDIAARLRRLLP